MVARRALLRISDLLADQDVLHVRVHPHGGTSVSWHGVVRAPGLEPRLATVTGASRG
jgi:hypothetical protein